MSPPPSLSTRTGAPRLRVGRRWATDGEAPARDRLGLEVHGVDLLAGAGDEFLVPVLEAWMDAVRRLVGGRRWAGVAFPGAGFTVALERVRDEVRWHRVPDAGPPVVLCPVTLELDGLRRALLEDTAELALALAARPSHGEEAEALSAARSALAAARPRTPRPLRSKRWPQEARALTPPVSLSLSLLPERGQLRDGDEGSLPALAARVRVGAGRGAPLACVEGASALRAAEGLLEAGLLLLGGVRTVTLLPGLEWKGGTLHASSREIPLPGPELARAALDVAHQLAALLVAFHPPASSHPAVSALLSRSAEALARRSPFRAPTGAAPEAVSRRPDARTRREGKPLAPAGARLKRLAFERAWSHPPSPLREGGQLRISARALLVGSPLGLERLNLSGVQSWFLPAENGVALDTQGRHAVVAKGGARLLGLEHLPSRGASWLRGPALLAPEGSLCTFGDTWCLASSGRGISGLCASTGRELWRLPLRGRGWLTSGPRGAWLSSDTGALLLLAPETGAVLAAHDAGLPYDGPPTLHRAHLSAVASGQTRAVLTVADAATGGLRLRTSLALGRTGPALSVGRRWFLAGERSGEARLVALTQRGEVAWDRALPGPGPWSLAAAGSCVLAANTAGAAVCVKADGRIAWTSGSGAPDVAREALPPLVTRGVAFVFGPEIRALEVRTGELLARCGIEAPVHAGVTDGRLGLYVLDESGRLTAWKLRGHLAELAP
jgi:hypothetical protein